MPGAGGAVLFNKRYVLSGPSMILRSRLTGGFCDVGSFMSKGERCQWRFKKRVRDFDRQILRLGLSYSFLTLTQSPESVESGLVGVHEVMHSMGKLFKRRGLPFGYVSMLEIQPRRVVRFGVLAPHHHIVVASVRWAFPHGEYHPEAVRGKRYERVRDGDVVTFDWLIENWKMKVGQFFVCDGYSRSVFGYLEKYLTGKNSELVELLRAKFGKKLRVFSSSRFEVIDQMAWFQKKEFREVVRLDPALENLYWHREGSSIVGRGKEVREVVEFDGRVSSKVSYPRVKVLRGEWV
jgi:hypothetical protein